MLINFVNLRNNAGIYFVTDVINALIPFFLLPILTRFLSPEEYGEVGIFITLISAFSALVGLTFVSSINRKFFDEINEAEYSSYISSAIQLILIFSLLTLFIVFLFIEHIANFFF